MCARTRRHDPPIKCHQPRQSNHDRRSEEDENTGGHSSDRIIVYIIFRGAINANHQNRVTILVCFFYNYEATRQPELPPFLLVFVYVSIKTL